jgi:hypothetical protein
MRNLSKALVIAAGLLAIGVSSTSVLAKNLLVGSFTLAQPIQWKNTMLPAGDYTFRLARTQTDTNILKVQGKNKALDIMVFAQSACETCKKGAIQLDMQAGMRVVTSLELPGFHVDFNGKHTPAQQEEMGKNATPSEQIAVHVDSNN